MLDTILIGRLGRDPELRTTQSGHIVCTMNVAETEIYTDSHGERHERTTWVRCTAWAGLGEVLANYHRKGDRVALKGRPSASAWIGKDGKARPTLELLVSDFEFVKDRRQEGDDDPRDAAPPLPDDFDDEKLAF